MSRRQTDMPMLINVVNYIVDTMHLTTGQHGAYFLLLMAYWRRRGPLPDDDAQLASICKATAEEWVGLRRILAPFFIVGEGIWRCDDTDDALASSHGFSWAMLRRIVFERDGFQCVYCDDDAGPFHCDHVVPVSRGGRDTLNNLATACWRCNISKGASTPEEWRARQGVPP